jgi:hypothetical protein
VESPGKIGVKDLGRKLAKVSLGNERGFKLLPDNSAKMLSCTNCRLGKARSNPIDGDNGGRAYPLSPQINPPLALLKDKSNTRGKSQVTLGENEMEIHTYEEVPL